MSTARAMRFFARASMRWLAREISRSREIVRHKSRAAPHANRFSSSAHSSGCRESICQAHSARAKVVRCVRVVGRSAMSAPRQCQPTTCSSRTRSCSRSSREPACRHTVHRSLRQMSTAKEVLRQSHRAATLEQLHSTAAPHTASWSRNRRPDQPYCDLPDTTPAARESNACGRPPAHCRGWPRHHPRGLSQRLTNWEIAVNWFFPEEPFIWHHNSPYVYRHKSVLSRGPLAWRSG